MNLTDFRGQNFEASAGWPLLWHPSLDRAMSCRDYATSSPDAGCLPRRLKRLMLRFSSKNYNGSGVQMSESLSSL